MPEQSITITDPTGANLVFSGWILSRHPSGAGTSDITIGYRCVGLKWKAYTVPITAQDGTGTMAFNLPPTDSSYSQELAGFSVGEVLTSLFEIDAPALASVGISADTTTNAQLTALTVVPPDPIYLQGPSLWSQVDQIMQQWYGSRYIVCVLPSGLIRLIDTYALTQKTLTFGTDPITLSSMQEDTSECYTQVILRGRDLVIPATISLSAGDLVDPNTVNEETWTLNDFLYPKGGFDQGTITFINSTQCTIKSSNPTLAVGVNYWSGIQAGISLINPNSNLVTGYEFVYISANTAMVAGGTCMITFQTAIGSVGYTNYQIRGQNVGLSGSYREYVPTNQYVREHLVEYFPFAVNFGNNQSFAAQVTSPIAVVTINNSGLPWQFSPPFQVIPWNGSTGGYFLFQTPIVTQFNSQQTLIQGGSAVQKPADVCFFAPYSAGTLSVQSPSGGGYSGTAFTLFGCERTLYRDYPTWIDPRQTGPLQMLSDSILATVSQALQEGSVTYHGNYADALTPGSPIALSLANFDGLTGYETMQAPCRSVTLEWPQSGASKFITRINFSTRRQQYSGDRLYLHANYREGGGWFGALGGFEGADFDSLMSQAFQGSKNAQMPDAPSPDGFSPLEGNGGFSPLG